MKNWPNRIIESYRIFPTFHSSCKFLKKSLNLQFFRFMPKTVKGLFLKDLVPKFPGKSLNCPYPRAESLPIKALNLGCPRRRSPLRRRVHFRDLSYSRW